METSPSRHYYMTGELDHLPERNSDMAASQLDGVLRSLRRAALPHDGGGPSDGQLLARFRDARDAAAFEALLRRHGPMVLGVCRRVLRHEQDAEDAFQATFLVLVRKAASVAVRGSLGGWLYGVAYLTAQKARGATARRRAKEKQMARPEAVPDPGDLWRELRPMIDQELSRLPDIYREAVVLCDLEGQTQKEAARRLGCPEGTVSGRLSRARAMLAKRLARRGLAPAGGAAALGLAHRAASAALPAPLVVSTVKAVAQVAAGHGAAGVVSAPVVALTERVLKTMCTSRLKLAFAAVLAVGLLGVGWGVYRASAAPKPEVNQPAPAVGSPGKQEEQLDLPQGPAPVQVLARIGADGKLMIKTTAPPPGAFGVGKFIGGPGGGSPAPGGKGVAAPGKVAWLPYDLDGVEVLDTKGNKLDKKEVVKLLKDETPAVASFGGEKVDPLHLRVLKDGILMFVLPPQKITPIGPVPAVPLGAPQAVPGGLVPNGVNFGVVPVGNVPPGGPIAPRPAPPK
jgi:RNA polymerase sigma factor (sigma-70 family)